MTTEVIRYFAYGSNLDLVRMRRRCPSARVLGVGALRDHHLFFAGLSRSWGAGVATVAGGDGEVAGLVYELDAPDLRRLDQFEGAPRWYQRTSKAIHVADSQVVEAFVYQLPPETPLVAPHPDYVRLIVHGLIAQDLPIDAVLEATWLPRVGLKALSHQVFVYGTLMANEGNAGVLREGVRLGLARTSPAFHLLDLGNYPAIVEGGTQSVLGEVYAVDAVTLHSLDLVEEVPTLYRRARIVLVGGHDVEVYLHPPVTRPKFIDSGDWRWGRRRKQIRAR